MVGGGRRFREAINSSVFCVCVCLEGGFDRLAKPKIGKKQPKKIITIVIKISIFENEFRLAWRLFISPVDLTAVTLKGKSLRRRIFAIIDFFHF